MYWQEEEERNAPLIPDDVVDLAFSIACKTLPLDHAYSLSQAVQEVLPWLTEEEGAGVHTIHVAESGNGWIRPNETNAILHPSRRTKLRVRVPKHRVEDAKNLSGKTLDLDGHTVAVKEGSVKLLSDHPTVFSRYIVTEGFASENDVLEEMVQQLKAMGIKPKKMLCGTETILTTPDKEIRTRSLMLADLSTEESVTLQMKGLGSHRWLGCGLFIPHKDIKEVKD
ncbi:MAG: type I-MYXAN CRISPR-associated protein Cas6/Cmx6 [Gammaproteobacteria bacterium]|jgi:CRISPR-associated protein Cas6|nr:type I-MYXAN CRISPR-associated protein Cas6/Cmx6 [Gammaproteobacteria bacterium]